MKKIVKLVLSSVLLAGLPAFAAAIAFALPQDKTQTMLRHDVTVALKLIQVSVLDKSGNPVTDLTKDDFELTDNGKTVVFDQFEKRIFGPQPEGTPGAAAGSGLRRRFFLIFDFSLMRPGGAVKARETALKFLDQVIQPTDEVAMVSYSVALGMRVHEYLTTDIDKIRKIIQSLQAGFTLGRAENLAQYWVTQSERDAAATATGKTGGLTDYEYASIYGDTSGLNKDKSTDLFSQAVQFCTQLRTLAKSLRYVPGTKNVILFSDGIPRPLLYGKRTNQPTSMSEWGEDFAALSKALSSYNAEHVPGRNLLEAFQKMMEEFKTANCPIYSIDTSQMREGADIEDREGLSISGSDITGSGPLRELSNGTGGRYLGNASNPEKAFETVRNLMGAIYVLGYPIKDSRDGKYHKIKVKVRRKDCEVVAQAGYYNPKPYSEYSTDDKLFQLMDLALSDSPQFLSQGGNLPFVAFPVWEQGWPFIAGIARIPGDKSAEVLGRNAETFLLILNEKNDLQSIVTFKFGDKAPGQGALDARFVMPTKPGTYNLRFVARNRVSGWGARGNAFVVVPDASAAASWVDPPLLLRPAGDIVTSEGTPTMTLARLYPYDATGYAPAIGPVPAGTLDLWAVLRCSAGLARTNIEVTGTIASEGRPEAAVPVTILKQEELSGPIKLLFVQFPASGLAPGIYTLTFNIKETNGFLSGAAAVTFQVQ
jgi:VWFA-related protein